MAIESTTDVRLVPQARLKVDHLYQRKLDPAWTKYLKDHWKPELLGVILVSSRANGDMVVLDGQHRLATLRELLAEKAPVPEGLWAEVYFNLSVPEEAAIFRGRNNRKAPHTIDTFRARLVAGEPTAVKIDATLRKYGTTWDYDSQKGYACVALLEKINGWGMLDSTVKVVEESWPNGTFSAAKRKRQIVEGVGIFLASAQGRPGYSDDIAISRIFDRVNAVQLLKLARNESLTSSVNQSVVVARKLRDAYNRNAKLRLPEVIPPKGYRG